MAKDGHPQSDAEIVNCVECGKVLNDPKNRGDPDVNGEWVCADATCRAIHDADMTSGPGADDPIPVQELSGVDAWKAHNRSFSYDPPEKPADAWSSEEYQELHDRMISRRVQWFCDKCTGTGPIGTLEKARKHVASNHSQKLVEQYAPDRDELETATDGGGRTRTERREQENHELTGFESDKE